jgi:hypothetical protein
MSFVIQHIVGRQASCWGVLDNDFESIPSNFEFFIQVSELPVLMVCIDQQFLGTFE